MGTEKKNGKKVETKLSETLHRDFDRKCRKNNTSMAQVLRDAAQVYTRGTKRAKAAKRKSPTKR